MRDDVLSIYGDEVAALAEVARDFDLLSSAERDAWTFHVWQQVAQVLGFEAALEEAVRAARRSRARLAELHGAGLTSFAAWAGRLDGPPMILNSRAMLATVRQGSIQAMNAAGLRVANVWAVQADASALPGGACYPHQRLGEPLGMRRAFEPDAGPGYFADAAAGPPPADESPCGWTAPVRLNLGTFPWVYGSQLGRHAPGLSWQTGEKYEPAAAAMRIAASMWTPLGNLRQDARVVAAQLRHFRRLIAPLFAEAPSLDVGGRPRPPGPLHRCAGLLIAEHGSLELVGADGPRGRVAATAHNYVLQRFAVFFAMRRAVLRARAAWTPEMQRAASDNPDPGLRLVPARRGDVHATA